MKKNSTMPSTSINLDIMAGGKVSTKYADQEALIISRNTKDATQLHEILEDAHYNVSIKSNVQRRPSPIHSDKFNIAIIDVELISLNHQAKEHIQSLAEEIIVLTPTGQPDLIKAAKTIGIENFIIQPLNHVYCSQMVNKIARDHKMRKELEKRLNDNKIDLSQINDMSLTLKNASQIKKTAQTLACVHKEPKKRIFSLYKILLHSFIQSNMDLKPEDIESFALQGIYEEDLLHISSLRNSQLIPTRVLAENINDKTLITLSYNNKNTKWAEELRRHKLFDELKISSDQITAITYN